MWETQETLVRSLSQEDPLEEMATHSDILAWKVSWIEEPGGLQSIGAQGVRHNWVHTDDTLILSYLRILHTVLHSGCIWLIVANSLFGLRTVDFSESYLCFFFSVKYTESTEVITNLWFVTFYPCSCYSFLSFIHKVTYSCGLFMNLMIYSCIIHGSSFSCW